jgi:hypothetical protein
MRRVACVVVLVLFVVVPALGFQKPEQPNDPVVVPVPRREFVGNRGGAAAQAAPAYAAPKSDGAVVELIDESVEPIFSILNNDNSGETGGIFREDRDVFSGVEAVRIAPLQRYSSNIPGWTFKIVEKPAKGGEFRFVRLAWKKIGGTGIMVQFRAPDARQWDRRLFAGRNSVNWQPAIQMSDKLPGEWTVVTHDLFKEFGAFTITGFALTAMDGQAALFDHILLGRTVEDLDKTTATALGKEKLAAPLTDKERETLWAEMIGMDAKKAAAALRVFLASAADHTAFIREKLGEAPDKEQGARVAKLLAELDAEKFDTREAATEELIKMGAPAIDAVRELARNATNDEVRYRCRVILKKLGAGAGAAAGPVGKAGRLARVVRVLERASTTDARTLLSEIAEGKLAAEVAVEAKAALARLPKEPKE